MFSSGKKIVIISAFVIVIIALANVTWWVYYKKTESMMNSQLGRRLEAISHIGAHMIDKDMVATLETDDQAYFEVISYLESIKTSDSLADLFLVDENYRILATTSLENDSVYFLAGLNGRYIDSVFISFQEITVSTPSYKTGSVFLKSAFAPVYDAEGYIMAVLGVEASVDYFDSLVSLRQNLWYATFISILGGIIIGIIFLLLQRRINETEQKLFLNETHSFLGRMVAVVSHELKNPLMIIRASAERLSKKTELEESKFVIEEVDRLNEIVTGYLDFAGVKGSLLEKEIKENVNLTELIENIKKHFQDKFPGQKIEWLNEHGNEQVNLKTYPRSLRQVILNLLINGAEACIVASRPIKVGIAAKNEHDKISITITDHGAGLDKRELKKIFKPFYTTKTTGSGLGLYLSKKIIEEFDGKLDIKSELGIKTEIIISIKKE